MGPAISVKRHFYFKNSTGGLLSFHGPCKFSKKEAFRLITLPDWSVIETHCSLHTALFWKAKIEQRNSACQRQEICTSQKKILVGCDAPKLDYAYLPLEGAPRVHELHHLELIHLLHVHDGIPAQAKVTNMLEKESLRWKCSALEWSGVAG